MVVREIHQMRESELTLVEQLADQVAAMRLDQSRLQDRIRELKVDLEKAKNQPLPHSRSIRVRHRTNIWERLTFEMPIVAAALGVLAGGSFLTGI